MPGSLTQEQAEELRRAMGRMSVRDLSRGGVTDMLNQFRRQNMANEKGTGLLQTAEPFSDIRGLLDPQRSLAMQEYQQGFDDQYRSLAATFDQLRGRRGGAFQSGFLDYAQQESRRAIERRRQQELFNTQNRFSEQTLSMQAANEDARMRNDEAMLSVHGDDAYDYILNRRRSY